MSAKIERIKRMKLIKRELMEARKAPLFQPSESKENKDFFEKMTKKAKSAEYFAFPGQVSAIIALTKSLETYRLG
ncbi:MAG TPA: hypothetical protein EYG89_02155, partial [Bacteroidia bacterium]|nr:hypothetical protein [Bacteroidia bacterium]